jgi:hypothetical protein
LTFAVVAVGLSDGTVAVPPERLRALARRVVAGDATVGSSNGALTRTQPNAEAIEGTNKRLPRS